jgi:hypothetical protein
MSMGTMFLLDINVKYHQKATTLALQQYSTLLQHDYLSSALASCTIVFTGIIPQAALDAL